MREYAEKLNKTFVPENDGYSFVKNEVLYLPIFEVQLSITKRIETKITLLEEMVLQLINEKVHDLGELSSILGINQKLLEITVADLHVKNMISYSSNNCALKSEGRVAINELKKIERKKDILRNVHFDSLSGDIIKDYDLLDFINYCNDDNKLATSYEPYDIELYRQRIKDVKEVFYNENNYLEDRAKSKVDELVSLDSIEKVFIKFLKIPLHLYVSNTGKDIDFIYKNSRDRSRFQEHKLKILNQIKNREALKYVFKNYKLNKKYEKVNLKEKPEIIGVVKDCLASKKNYKVENISNLVFSDRKLFDGEILTFYEILCKDATKIDIYAGMLEDLLWNRDITELFNILKNKGIIQIVYNDSSNEQENLKKFSSNYPEVISSIKREKHNYFLKIVVNEKSIILASPEEISVIDGKYNITKIDYFFMNLEEIKLEGLSDSQ